MHVRCMSAVRCMIVSVRCRICHARCAVRVGPRVVRLDRPVDRCKVAYGRSARSAATARRSCGAPPVPARAARVCRVHAVRSMSYTGILPAPASRRNPPTPCTHRTYTYAVARDPGRTRRVDPLMKGSRAQLMTHEPCDTQSWNTGERILTYHYMYVVPGRDGCARTWDPL